MDLNTEPRTFRKRAMYENLMEAVVREENCKLALVAVTRNQGAAGIDRMKTTELEKETSRGALGKDSRETADGNVRTKPGEEGGDTQTKRGACEC